MTDGMEPKDADLDKEADPDDTATCENADGQTESDTFLTENDPVSKTKNETANELNDESISVNYKDLNLIQRLKLDHPFRRRFTHTLWLFWAFVGLGWSVGQMGPSFPDLRLIVKQDIDSASWLFTIHSVGYMVGSFGGGILYDHCYKLSLIIGSTFMLAVFTTVIPWCKWFPLMLTVRFFTGLGCGGLDTGGNADLVSLWDEEGRPYMQALHFCFGFGGIIAPLVVEPFLAKKECVLLVNNTGINQAFLDSEDNVSMTTINDSMTTMGLDWTNIDSGQNSANISCIDQYGETNIHYAYLISFFVIGSSMIGFIYMYLESKCKKKIRHMAADKSNNPRPDKLSYQLKAIFLVLLFIIMMTYCAVEDTFSGFLATFCIGHLKWDKGTASFATSVHWSAFSVGRFSGIFLIKCFKPVQLMFAYLIMLMCGLTGLLIVSVIYSPALVWIFIGFSGFSMSIVFPCLFTWTEESILKVSGKISAMFLIAASGGLMLNPLFLGYVMDNIAPIYFIHIILSESILCFLIFLLLLILVRKYVVVPNPAPLNMEVVVKASE
ncbi:hypothetical protein ACF0H5_011808 [Mactra antiquata]